jgi:hypothetical protein
MAQPGRVSAMMPKRLPVMPPGEILLADQDSQYLLLLFFACAASVLCFGHPPAFTSLILSISPKA